MEDISRKISELLSDPEALEQIKGLTGMLSQGNTVQNQPETEEQPAVNMPDSSMLGAVMKLAPLMQSVNREDDSTRLLKALKPFLHNERSKRVDSAIRLLGIMKMLPLLKNSGIDLF